MPSTYYNPSTLTAGTTAKSADLNTEFTSIETGFATVETDIAAVSASVVALGGTPGSVTVPTAAASQVEMEAGTEVALRYMSPLRVKQAIVALGADAVTLTDLGVTSSAAELSIMNGVTAATGEINGLDGLTASRAIVTTAGGILTASAVTATEVEYLSGVTSAIQTQLNGKAAAITGAATTIVTDNLPASRALVSDGSGKVAASATITSTELGRMNGVTSAIQTQINNKGIFASAKVTINGGSAPTIANSYNITAGSAGGTGYCTITFDSAAASANLVVIATTYGSFGVATCSSVTASEMVIRNFNNSLAAADGIVNVVVFGPY